MNPLDVPYKILAAAIFLAMYGGLSFMGGCDYNEKKTLAALERGKVDAARDAKQDGVAGANTAAFLRQQEEGFKKGALSLSKEADKAPLVITSCPVRNNAPQASQTTNSKTPETVNETAPVVRLSADFIRLYDNSFLPEGDPRIRTGTPGTTALPTINEGFSAYIIPNNSECAQDREVLRKIQERIEQKKKIYANIFKE